MTPLVRRYVPILGRLPSYDRALLTGHGRARWRAAITPSSIPIRS
jgi:hypothetical protein